MSVDKKIDYVNQDGYKNYIKDSKSVTVPVKFKSKKDEESQREWLRIGFDGGRSTVEDIERDEGRPLTEDELEYFETYSQR